MLEKKLIIIIGPTGVGKTNLSIELALHFKTEIISADSRQIYKELHIGTAKPSEKECSTVPHHFINSHSINDLFNVGKYEQECIYLLTKLFQNHNSLILVGGTGLYIDAICNGIDVLPETDIKIRNELENLFAQQGIKALQEKLKEVDIEYYKIVDLNNRHRLIRALEVSLVSGKPYSSFRKKNIAHRTFTPIKIGLNINREALYDRINKRVDGMIKQGLVEEAKNLFPYKHLNAMQTVGYQELFDHFEGKITLEQAIELIKQNSRRYAKRQLTWFKRDKKITWFEPNEKEKIIDFIKLEMER
ncbi:MAG: tRNA (adenosine(37)-N6)-dimethylallyltransferase MiaA [Bacteroidetes bacterium RIFCSPLOWO2_12_FULL_31_6]|nr:MAG: tRNA (adenosine(37)-N6)-dimethylallyltransferase MiaA [Bacteroidetes bacterium RIFCSPLOWO2_12_FULL_31_6]